MYSAYNVFLGQARRKKEPVGKITPVLAVKFITMWDCSHLGLEAPAAAQHGRFALWKTELTLPLTNGEVWTFGQGFPFILCGGKKNMPFNFSLAVCSFSQEIDLLTWLVCVMLSYL